MSDYGTDQFTSIQVETDIVNEWNHEHVYVHVNEVDEPDEYEGMTPHIYCYESERDQYDLPAVISEFRSQFIFAQGVVFPDIIEEFMPDLGVEELNAIEWTMVLGEDEVTRYHVEYIIEYLEEDETDT